MTEPLHAIKNARIVLADRVITGFVEVEGGVVQRVESGAGPAAAEDFGNDFLLPGLVELHTDALERHFMPRPGVVWPPRPAVMAHDAQIAASGITTVFDALRMGSFPGDGALSQHVIELAAAIEDTQAGGMLRAEHLLHLRCEVSCESVLEDLHGQLDHPAVRLVSVMDHTPGQRQFADEAKYRAYFQGRYKISDVEMDRVIVQQKQAHDTLSESNRRQVVALCAERDLPLASHDDATPEQVCEAHGEGMVIAEFPTTVEAAEASHGRGMLVLMGSPNVVRGGSHSGNVSALEMARRGILDILSSDYMPCSLLHAAFLLPQREPSIDLAAAVRTVSSTPAQAVGLTDRGEIAVGRRADLIRVHVDHDVPVMRAAWRAGQRVS